MACFTDKKKGDEKKLPKKTIASITLLMIALILASIFLAFLTNQVDACFRRRRHPPLGKTIIKYFVYPDGTPIGPCLEVELWNDGNEPIAYAHTDYEGKVVFPGLYDGTFTVEWSWQGQHYEEMVRINCNQIVWEFTNELPYWTVIKTFYYDTVPPLPISHLKVTMNGYEGETDETGTIVFSNVKAGEYTVAWVWGSEPQSEGIEIGFQTESPVELTNYLEPKSVWRQNLRVELKLTRLNLQGKPL